MEKVIAIGTLKTIRNKNAPSSILEERDSKASFNSHQKEFKITIERKSKRPAENLAIPIHNLSMFCLSDIISFSRNNGKLIKIGFLEKKKEN